MKLNRIRSLRKKERKRKHKQGGTRDKHTGESIKCILDSYKIEENKIQQNGKKNPQK